MLSTLESRLLVRAVVILTAVLLSGCETVGKAVDSTTRQLGRATSTLLGSDVPPDDGTICYQSHRIPFYDEVNDAATSNTLLAGVGDIVVPAMAYKLGGTYSSVVGARLTENFVATLQAVLEDVQSDTQQIDALTGRLNELMACRRSEAAEVNSRYQADGLSFAEATASLSKLRALVAVDVAKAKATNVGINARSEEFQLAAKQARQQVDAAPTPAVRKKRKKEVQRVEEAVQTNQKALNESVASVDEAERLASDPEGEFQLAALFWVPGNRGVSVAAIG